MSIGSQLHVGFLLQNPSPHQVDLINAVADTPYVSVTAYYINRSNPQRQWGSPIANTEVKYLEDLELTRESWLNEKMLDIWVLNGVYTARKTYSLARALNQTNASWVYWAEPIRPRNRLSNCLRNLSVKRLLEGASGVLTMGKEAVRRYEALVPGVPVTSVPYSMSPPTTLKAVPLQKNLIRFVVSAQLIERKGVDFLLEACRELPSSGWRLDIFGAGPLKHQLQTTARSVSGNIRFRGTKSYPERYSVFQDQDVLVMPTRWDGWGMVVPEALYSGLPVISTDRAMSAHEFINNGINGYIINHKSPSELAHRMKSFIEKPVQAYGMREAARASVAHYQPAVLAETLISFLNQVLSRS